MSTGANDCSKSDPAMNNLQEASLTGSLFSYFPDTQSKLFAFLETTTQGVFRANKGKSTFFKIRSIIC